MDKNDYQFLAKIWFACGVVYLAAYLTYISS
ncbi:hypothetical protein DFO56_102446 [Kosakonia sp. AG348]|nr:hypothetical protein H650_03720 [Enterobacter sp. R4-368]RCX04431.1 hypothetical protein DFO56_102446 [Kosakonia sp. AG348]